MSETNFINRELSWLAFNERVLMEASDIGNPLMERLKFTSIFSSNMDEFFMVRVAGLKEQVSYGFVNSEPSGLNPEEQLKEIYLTATKLKSLQKDIFESLKSAMEAHNIIFSSKNEQLWEEAEAIFIDEIMSVITPVTLDPAHPFPFIYNKRISIIAELERNGKKWLSLIMLPENIRRFFKVRKDGNVFILMTEDIIKHNLARLYKGFEVKGAWVFRVTRNADLKVREEEAHDLMQVIQDSISRRNKGFVTRVEAENGIPDNIVNFLKKMVVFNHKDIYFIDGTIDLTFLTLLADIKPQMQFTPFNKFTLANIPKGSAIFDRIKEKDILSYRPYYCFSIVSELIATAASDPDVLAIKMTLYRTNKDSSILASLVKAAKSGKQVSVVVELKARFDEERNIGWARNLEEAGCIVTYGMVGLKVHGKCLLIVRREKDSIVRYTHIATGNYNENTANLYTDVDLITADEHTGRDAAQLFNCLMGHTEEKSWRRLFVAPFNMREGIEKLFDEETAAAKRGEKAHVIMKINSLTDEAIIQKMYEASQAGVKINLIVRGICGLKAEVKGLSENITVRSIVGRFLEHARIFYFRASGANRFFIASSDMMPRNLNRRVELMTEITDSDNKASLMKYLDIALKDNMKSWQLKGDKYIKNSPDENCHPINSQEYFLNNRLI